LTDYNFFVDEQLRKNALEYHRRHPPGKLSVLPTKQVTNQRDLALAYSPGVAAACEEIVRDPLAAMLYTSRANLIGVVTNGTAVLGLGAIGPLAAKPVMEGKAVLFKKFAGIDCFDIELDERDPERLVEIIAALEPTFGAINLEDIKAPECFLVERALRKRGARLGPLHGVPFSVKDLVITRGVRTTFGTPLYRDNVPTEDAPIVARLKAAGAILLGKTNTPTMGWIGATHNLLFGITRNPWNLDRTPGGSSGGAAAALAAEKLYCADRDRRHDIGCFRGHHGL